MANINFYRKDTKKDYTSLQAIIRYRSKRYKYYTGISIVNEFWDESKHRCKLTKKYPDAGSINIRLDKIETDLKSLFTNYEINNVIPTLEQFKLDSDFNNTRNRNDRRNIHEMITEHREISTYEEDKSFGTLDTWMTKYEDEFSVKLYEDSFDQDWYQKFKTFYNEQTYTRGEEVRYYTLNYLGSLMKNLKVVLRTFELEPKFVDRKSKRIAEIVQHIYFKQQELNDMWDYNPTLEDVLTIVSTKGRGAQITLRAENKLKSIVKAKQLLFIACYTGLRVSDFSRLKNVNIDQGNIRIQPWKGSKINEAIVIPMNHRIKEIFNNDFDFDYRISDQKLNDSLKDFCKLAGLNQQVSKLRTEGGKRTERIYEKWELVTTHTGRRTFASYLVRKNIQTEKIMELMGKSSYEDFKKYVGLDAEEIANDIAGVLEEMC